MHKPFDVDVAWPKRRADLRIATLPDGHLVANQFTEETARVSVGILTVRPGLNGA